jgi:hypothetical protein
MNWKRWQKQQQLNKYLTNKESLSSYDDSRVNLTYGYNLNLRSDEEMDLWLTKFSHFDSYSLDTEYAYGHP